MKKYLYIIPAIFFALTTMSSCSFLDPYSETQFIPTQATDLDKMILGNAIMKKSDVNAVYNLYLSMMDDDVKCHDYITDAWDYNNKIPLYPYKDEITEGYFSIFTWQPNYNYTMRQHRIGSSMEMYRSLYKYLLGANLCFDYIDRVSGTETEKNYILAQAHALRATYYFQLVNLYGQPYNYVIEKNPTALGVPLKLTANYETRPMKRNTVVEVYDQVVSDLTEAERLYEKLPAAQQWKPNGRTSLPMVQLLLSRVYLYMENWEKSAEYSHKVMTEWNGKFQLNDLKTVTVPTADILNGDQYPNLYSYAPISGNSSTESIWLFGNATNSVILEASAKLTAYSGIDDSTTELKEKGTTTNKNPPLFLASDALLDSYEDGDLRKTFYILEKNSEYDPKTLKWKVHYSKFMLNYGYGPSGYGVVFRLSEAYLNYAEAMAMLREEGINSVTIGELTLDTQAEALAKLGELRAKRFAAAAPEVVISGTKTLKESVQDERRRELCYEGHRWFDLRRWGMDPITHEWKVSSETKTYTLKKDDPAYTLEIPSSIMEDNANLIQNPLPGVRTN